MAVNWSTALQAAGAILATVVSLVGVGGRGHRRRLQIKANVELLDQLRNQSWFAQSFHSQAVIWLESRVALDIARLSGVPTSNPKKPIPWAGVVLASLLFLIFGGWGVALSRGTYNWWSLPLFVLAGLMALSIPGQFMNREIPPSEASSNGPSIPNLSWLNRDHMIRVLELKADLADIGSSVSTRSTTRDTEFDATELLGEMSARHADFASRLRFIIRTTIDEAGEKAPDELRSYLLWPSNEDIIKGVDELTSIVEEAGISSVLGLMANASGDALNLSSGNEGLPAAIFADSDRPLIKRGLVHLVSRAEGAQPLSEDLMSVAMTDKGRQVARLLVADWPPQSNLDDDVLQRLTQLRYDQLIEGGQG